MLSPFIRNADGKAHVSKDIVKVIPETTTVFVNPFLGDGCVFIDVLNKFDNIKCVCSDINIEVINAYNFVKKDPDGIIQRLERYERMYNATSDKQKVHLKISEIYSDAIGGEDVDSAALFIALNRASVRGMFKFLENGTFSVPYCGSKTISLYDSDNILYLSKRFSDCEFMVCEYDTHDITGSDVVYYFDPVYKKRVSNGSTKPVYGLHSVFDDMLVRLYCKKLNSSNTGFILSRWDDGDDEYIRTAYNKVELGYHNDKTGRGFVKEAIYTNLPITL